MVATVCILHFTFLLSEDGNSESFTMPQHDQTTTPHKLLTYGETTGDTSSETEVVQDTKYVDTVEEKSNPETLIVAVTDSDYKVDPTSTVHDHLPSVKHENNLFICHACKKVYATRAGLYKHRRTYHPNVIKRSTECSESKCKCTFKALAPYRHHLQSVHGIPMASFTKDFKSHEGMYMQCHCVLILCVLDFEQWKTTFEQETNSSFVKATGEKAGREKRLTYYYCNRSGYFSPSGRNVRALKSQGTAKLDSYCTAAIILTKGDVGTHYKANVYSTHHGLGYLRLQRKDKYTIAA